MKKGIKFILLSVFLVFVFSFKTTEASWLRAFFGGKIINMKAVEIQALESAGFNCVVPGQTITILPIGSPSGTPTEYFIPFSTVSKTRNSIHTGQTILGKYIGKTIITCILPKPPLTHTVSLDTITIYGTSGI